MRYPYFFKLIVLICFLFLSGCGKAPIVTHENNVHKATAMRFLQNIGAGELIKVSCKMTMEKQAIENPAMAEVLQRVFANMMEEDFLNIATDAYSRNITREDLIELAGFSEKPAIQKYFKVLFDGLTSGKPLKNEELMKQFNADEIIEIMKFSKSESCIRMSKTIDKINREMATAANKYGQEKLNNYLKTH